MQNSPPSSPREQTNISEIMVTTQETTQECFQAYKMARRAKKHDGNPYSS